MIEPCSEKLLAILNADERFAALRGQRVCITGGAGFIGSHLGRALVVLGAEVTVIDDLSNGRESNLDDVADRIRFVRGSILDTATLQQAVDGAQTVFHLAAVASVPRSVREPSLYVETNALGTLRVLEAVRAADAKRLIYAASSSAYGDQPGMPRVESMPVDARSPYAAAKCTGEYLLRSHAQCFDLSCVSLRYFNIFGPRQQPDSAYAAVIPLFTRALMNGEAPTVFGDGSQTRDFTHVANAVYANLLAATSRAPLAGQVLNIACGGSASVLDLLTKLADRLGVEATWNSAAPRPGEVQDSLASIDAARELIDYRPIIDLDEGLDETAAHYRDYYASQG